VFKGSPVETYLNLGGNSNVIGYEIARESITVYFGDGSAYLYTYQSAGNENVEEMKRLAMAGQGLNSFIKRIVNKAYAAKLK